MLNAQELNLKFKRYTISEGLSQNTINTIYQSKNGFIWLGTDDGLNRYDGSKFKVYQYDLENNKSISNNSVTSIYEDTKKQLWIGTNNGLNILNTDDYSFSRYFYNDIEGLVNNSIIKIIPKDSLNIIIASTKGIVKLNINNKKVVSLFKNNETIRDIVLGTLNNLYIVTSNNIYNYNISSKETNLIFTINKNINFNKLITDTNNNLWLGTNNGLYLLDKSFKIINHFNKDINHDVSCVFEDSNNNIWAGTDNGIYLINNHKIIAHLKNEPNNLNSLSYNLVQSIFEDEFGVVWIGSYHGLNNTVLDQANFNHFSLFPRFSNEISSNLTWKMIKDKKDNLWIATGGGGLYVYNEINDIAKKIPYQFSTDSKNEIYSIDFDNYNNLWVGGTFGILYIPSEDIENIWNNENTSIKRLPNILLPKNFSITNFTKRNDTIWANVLDKGILEITSTDKGLKNIEYNFIKSTKGRSTYVYLDEKLNKLWIGNRNGLKTYNLKNKSIKNFNLKDDKNLTLEISALNKFNDSILWIGSFSSGLIKYNLNNKTSTFITTKNGLANNSIYGILKSENDIWVSSNKGISRVNTLNNSIKNFDTRSGLQSNEFGEGSYYIDDNKKMYFGGINGINSFYAKDITSNTIEPKIIITDFKIFDKPIEAYTSNKDLGLCKHKHPIIYKNITNIDTLNLNYQHRIFSFKVAVIHSQNETKNKYAYKLSSVDKNWNIRDISNNQFTYTNVSPGEYNLYIKACNSDGLWSKPKLIYIRISPPFWQTYWFYILVSLFIVTIAYFLLKFWKRQIKLEERKEFLQDQNEQKATVIKEIHHRIKNNLQVVNSLLRIQSSKIDDKKVKNMLKKTQNRVLSMATIHEKMYQTQNLHSLNTQEHLVPLIKDLIKAYGVDKKIELALDIESVNFKMRTLTPLGLIINELISNSLKYAFNNLKKGTIYVSLKKLNDVNKFILSVGDNGKGFNHSEITNSNQIGTKLIHSFVRQLKGSIELLETEGTHYKIIFYDIDNE